MDVAQDRVNGVGRNNNLTPRSRRSSSRLNGSAGGDGGGSLPSEQPHIIDSAEAEQLRDCLWADVAPGDHIYVPFDMNVGDGKGIQLKWFLGKVTNRRTEDVGDFDSQNSQIVLACEWLNGDQAHEVKELENPDWKLKWPRSHVQVKMEPAMDDNPLGDDIWGKEVVDERSEGHVFRGKVVRKQILYVVKADDGTEKMYTPDELRGFVRG